LYLSSVLKQHGHEVRLVDGFFHQGSDFEREVLSSEPELLGFWCTQFSWDRTKAISMRLKERSPGLRVVVGGTHATALGRQCLEEPDSGGLDFIVMHDGEDAMVEICEALAGHMTLTSVRGLVWRDGAKVVVNASRPFCQDLDAFAFPDYDLLDIAQYRPAIGSYKCLPSVNMMTQRGCAGGCSFCHAANSLRSRSIDNVIEEIRWLQGRYKVQHLLFFDETFTYERERVVEFCRRIDEAGIRIAWTCNSRVDTIDSELLDLMKKAGCWRLQFGGESGVQKQLDTIQKGITPAQTRRAIEMTRRAGMESFVSFMLGIPGETYEDGLRTIRFAVSLPADYVNFLNFIPLAGSLFYTKVERLGTMVGPTAFHRIAFVPHSMTYEQLADLMVRSVKSYYLRLSYLIPRFFKQRSLEDVRRNMRGFFGFIRMDSKKDF